MKLRVRYMTSDDIHQQSYIEIACTLHVLFTFSKCFKVIQKVFSVAYVMQKLRTRIAQNHKRQLADIRNLRMSSTLTLTLTSMSTAATLPPVSDVPSGHYGSKRKRYLDGLYIVFTGANKVFKVSFAFSSPRNSASSKSS